jgi:hypothetical protein
MINVAIVSMLIIFLSLTRFIKKILATSVFSNKYITKIDSMIYLIILIMYIKY